MPEGYVVLPDSREEPPAPDAVYIYLNNTQSGAAMAWSHFHAGHYLPQLIAYVQDYDLWKFGYGDRTRYINKYLRGQVQTLDNWDVMYKIMEDKEDIFKILDIGKALQDTYDVEVLELAATAVPIRLKGQDGYFVSCHGEYVSDVGHMVAKRFDTFCAMCDLEKALVDNKAKAKDVAWSLRSDKDWDVSILAPMFGGGGHKNAAGFTINFVDTLDLINRPNIRGSNA